MGNVCSVSPFEHRRNEEILARWNRLQRMAMRRLEWFGQVNRRNETENIRTVVEMKMEKRPKGRLRLRLKDIVRRDIKAWKMKEEWAADREKGKDLCKTCYTTLGNSSER